MLVMRNEQARLGSREQQEETEDNGQKIIDEAQNEVEFVLEITELRAGEDDRGSNASQTTNGCCFDPAIFEQISIILGELSRRYGTP